MELKSIIVGVVITLLVVGGIGGVVFGVSQMDSNPISQSSDTEQTETPEPVNQSEVPQEVKDSLDQTEDFRVSFSEEYDYSDATIHPRSDGEVVILDYNSTAGNSVKDELQNIALLYAYSTEGKDEMPALVIHTGGVSMTVPADTAIAHGNGNINEEAFLKNVRYDSAQTEDE